MTFTITHTDPGSSARAGLLQTDHGTVETPFFMPVGTAGAVKALHLRQLREDVMAQILLANTYHLYLRPGVEVITRAGGIHQFNGWNKPMLTDSGGYQVYSLAGIRKFNEEGVVFQSHVDGSKHQFTPESVIDIQRAFGADIIMAFDECTPYPCEYTYAAKSMKRTHRWLERCIARFRATECPYSYTQTLFPVVQGSVYRDLRIKSAEFIASCQADGNAIGGLSVGEPPEVMYEMTAAATGILPVEKPRYLMGVGTPANILEGIALGIDMFDCVIPTRNGRNGMLFTRRGILNIKNEKWKDDFSPLDPDGEVFTDLDYSRAFLRHLFVAREMLAAMIATVHNLGFYMWLLREARKEIMQDTFVSWKSTLMKTLTQRL